MDLCTWRYPAPYDCYDMTGADPGELLRPELAFHAVLSGEQLVGFRSYGADGRVPGWDYDDLALDTGVACGPSSSVGGWAAAPSRPGWPSDAHGSRRRRSG